MNKLILAFSTMIVLSSMLPIARSETSSSCPSIGAASCACLQDTNGNWIPTGYGSVNPNPDDYLIGQFSIILTGCISSAVYAVWTFGDGGSITTSSLTVSHAYNALGTFTWTLQLFNSNYGPATSPGMDSPRTGQILIDRIDPAGAGIGGGRPMYRV